MRLEINCHVFHRINKKTTRRGREKIQVKEDEYRYKNFLLKNRIVVEQSLKKLPEKKIKVKISKKKMFKETCFSCSQIRYYASKCEIR